MSELISCCSWCVAEGTEAAPPMERRTDGICGRHFLEMRARLLTTRSAGPSPRDGDTSALGVSAAGPAAIHGGSHPLADFALNRPRSFAALTDAEVCRGTAVERVKCRNGAGNCAREFNCAD